MVYCPICKTEVMQPENGRYICSNCGVSFRVYREDIHGTPVMMPPHFYTDKQVDKREGRSGRRKAGILQTDTRNDIEKAGRSRQGRKSDGR
jgi:uncharacterized protein YbaR (Trm112 family)